MQITTSIFYFAFLLLLTISLCHFQSAFGNHHFKNSFSELSGTTKPDCPSKCGNLTVPYPFGTGVEVDPTCSISPLFHLNCNSSFDPPKAFLGSDELEVLGIYDSEIRVKNRLSYACYYDDSQSEGGNYDQNSASPANLGFFSMNLTGTPFTFSNENKLTVVGCDDVAIMSSGSNDWDYSISSCVAICSKTEDLINGSCSGIGCCQSSIPKGLQSLYSSMTTLTSHNKVKSFNPCGYSFLAGPGSYTFETSDVSDSPFGNRTLESVSLVIDWAIGDRTCEQIRNTNEMICEGESVCVDSGTGLGGYRCNCSEGYFGNPYLSPGCRDINECEFNPCHGKAMCINLPGSFNCSCRPNYVGDGTKNGTGCIYLPSPSKTALYAGLPAGLGLFLTLAMSFWLYKTVKKRRAKQQKRAFFKRNGGLVLHRQMSTRDNSSSVLERSGIFTSKELEKATDRFNDSRILGRGGQGTVYKGMLSDGRIVAVKKSKQVNEGQLAEFVNEVVILSQINHRNVVRLLGCCLETEVPLLVYEFVPNGTLYHLIHEDTTGFPFSWDLRLRIAAEIANALAYLHYATSIPVYHRDMKSSNILLDEKYRAKLSDFGISRSVGIDVTHLTTKVKGTFGYLDPEYFQTSKFTEKSDVYSFGVVLVELLTGLKPILTSDETEERSLVTRFLLTMKENRLKAILDSKIIEQGVSEAHTAVADVAKRCLNLSGKKRPNIREVAVELERIRASRNPSFVESNGEDMSCTETESFVISGTEFWLWS